MIQDEDVDKDDGEEAVGDDNTVIHSIMSFLLKADCICNGGLIRLKWSLKIPIAW